MASCRTSLIMAENNFKMADLLGFLWVGREPAHLIVGGARAPLTLLSCSGQRFGTKSDVTTFIKPASRSISFIIWAFPGVASNIPDTIQSNFTMVSHLTVWTFEMVPYYPE